LQDEVGEALHVRVADRRPAAQQPIERDDELLERPDLVERIAAGIVARRPTPFRRFCQKAVLNGSERKG